jgi:hypothetical protein
MDFAWRVFQWHDSCIESIQDGVNGFPCNFCATSCGTVLAYKKFGMKFAGCRNCARNPIEGYKKRTGDVLPVQFEMLRFDFPALGSGVTEEIEEAT